MVSSRFGPSELVPIATLPREVFEYYYRPDDYDYRHKVGVARFHAYYVHEAYPRKGLLECMAVYRPKEI